MGWRRHLVLALLFATSCSSEQTSLRVTVNFEPALGIDQLRFKVMPAALERDVVDDPPAPLSSGLRVVLPVPDDWADRQVEITVAGLAGGKERASGQVSGTPRRAQIVDLSVTLAGPCTSPCTPGETRCEQGQIRLCQKDAHGCAQFGVPQACPSSQPVCSGDVCAAKCSDQCSSGQHRCRDAGYQICGKSSAGCLDWGPVLGCAADETCRASDGQCSLDCGGKPCPCSGNETQACQDRGQCRGGVRSCVEGAFGACVWQVGPQPEICDGKDNDCSGTPDDNLVAPACSKQQGVCAGARQACAGAAGWKDCDEAAYQARAQQSSLVYQPVESVCDGQDNDCNGKVDEPASCCQPQCSGKACGAPDGCGHPCPTGSCGTNASCQAGACVCQFALCGSACCASGQVCQGGVCTSGTTTPGFVSIPAGTFMMGSPASEPCRGLNEDQHQVTLTHAFELQATETTQGEFKALMGYNLSKFASCGSSCPVEEVSWHEAAAYCNALSAKKGLAACYSCSGSGASVSCSEAAAYNGQNIYSCPGYRLPTEAEWEYAYRAGTTTAYYNGANDPSKCASCSDANADVIAWYSCNSAGSTHPVAQKAANAWGLRDMAGNVWEFCHDWYSSLGTSAATDPWGSSSGTSRVTRGGSRDFVANGVRAARRRGTPTARDSNLGFRCGRTK